MTAAIDTSVAQAEGWDRHFAAPGESLRDDPVATPQDAPLPLAGVRVLDLGHVFQGPYATFLMAMAGAEIIKVESPQGDMSRRRGRDGDYPFRALNNTKRGIVLNLKTERGRELLIELAKKADVLVENFAPSVMPKLGLGADVLLKANPRLIYASASGFGRHRPLQGQAGAGPDDPGHERPDECHRRKRRPPAEGRRAGGRLHVGRAPVRRHHDGAVRARAHRPRPRDRGLDAGVAVRDAASGRRPCLHEQCRARAQRQPPRGRLVRAVRHLRGFGRPRRHRLRHRRALGQVHRGDGPPRPARQRDAAHPGRSHRAHRGGHRHRRRVGPHAHPRSDQRAVRKVPHPRRPAAQCRRGPQRPPPARARLPDQARNRARHRRPAQQPHALRRIGDAQARAPARARPAQRRGARRTVRPRPGELEDLHRNGVI